MTGESLSFHRIALVDPGDFSPPYDQHLARGLESQGSRVALIGQVGNGDVTSSVSRHDHFYRPLAGADARQLPRKLRQILKGFCHGFDMLALDRVLNTLGSEILHFQWLPLPLFDRYALQWLRRKRPVVLTIHDSNPYNGHGSRLMRAGHLDAAKCVDAVIVHTSAAARKLVAQGIDPVRIHRVPHGLLDDPGLPRTVPGRTRTKPLMLLQFGKIKPYKGVDVLLNALALLPPDVRADLQVHIVGKPYLDVSGFQRFVADHELGGTVNFRFAFVEEAEMRELIARADAILLPYRQIDASGVAMTALAYGLPVLATRVDGFLEVFEGNSGARLVAHGDAQAVAEVLRAWIAEPGQLDTMAIAMERHRERVPDWREIARMTLRVYAQAHTHWAAKRPAGNLVRLGETGT